MNNNSLKLINGILVLIIGGGVLLGFQQAGDEYQIYRGLLHAHTAISDGSGTPEEAYAMAKQHKLDFFAVTPHNHKAAEAGAKERKDGLLIATNNFLYNGSSVQNVKQEFKDGSSNTLAIKPLLMAANDATEEKFLAIYGQEFSTISQGNHMNVLGIDEVIKVPDGNFSALVDLLKQLDEPPILQLNHPNVQSDLFYTGSKSDTKKKMFNDYGIDEGDLGPHFTSMVKTLDEYVHLIEIFSGPAMQKGRKDGYQDKHPHHNDYFFYLSQGFHISPSAGQDNHYKTWGMATDIRTGVFAKKLTKKDIFDAFKGQRTFVSEDKNATIGIAINNVFMGGNVQAKEEESLKLEVFIFDEDELEKESEVSYTVYGGLVKSEDSKMATNHKQESGKLFEGNMISGSRKIILEQLTSGNPEFYYVVVEQEDGDRLYSGPVWVNYPKNVPSNLASNETTTSTPIFIWTRSKSSSVYHLEGCSSAQMIKSENKQSGTIPPKGRTLHKKCTVSEVEIGH